MGFRFNLASARVSAEIFSAAASETRVRRLSPARSLRTEQSHSYQEQILERCGHLQSVQVLRQASVTHFLKAEDLLDHPKHVLDFGTHTGLATVGCFDRLINAFTPAVALVGEVLRPRCCGADRRPLPAVCLIAPDSPLLPMQQMLQGVAVGHIGRADQHRVNQLRAAVDSNYLIRPTPPWKRESPNGALMSAIHAARAGTKQGFERHPQPRRKHLSIGVCKTSVLRKDK